MDGAKRITSYIRVLSDAATNFANVNNNGNANFNNASNSNGVRTDFHTLIKQGVARFRVEKGDNILPKGKD